ncbi:hypothetical protein ACPYO6_13910 [Georgenia sp. Z1344]|uniref:hypothetical protein n=1 Tax=Georgenia sp. Z1344 TaxID=3416706 RepID=UPI003CF8A328
MLLVVGLLVGAALGVGGTLAVTGGLLSSEPDGVTLPATLGGMRPHSEVAADQDGPAEFAALREEAVAEVADGLSAAHDGAAAAGQVYMSDDLAETVTVYAVAAEAPGLWSSEDSLAAAETMGIATPMAWVETDGEAQCLVRQREFGPLLQEGETPSRDVENVVVSMCQEVRDGVTVLVEAHGEVPLPRGLELVREAADQVQVD